MVAVIPTRKNIDTRNMNSVILSTLFTKLEAPENIFQILAVNKIQHSDNNQQYDQREYQPDKNG